MKCASDTCAIRARVGTSSGSAYLRSIASRARSSRRLLSSTALPTSGDLMERPTFRGPGPRCEAWAKPVLRSGGDAALRQPGQGVDLRAVLAALVHLEVQVGARGGGAVAEQRDRVAALHIIAGSHQDLVHVAVDGDVAVLVEDVDR